MVVALGDEGGGVPGRGGPDVTPWESRPLEPARPKAGASLSTLGGMTLYVINKARIQDVRVVVTWGEG